MNILKNKNEYITKKKMNFFELNCCGDSSS